MELRHTRYHSVLRISSLLLALLLVFISGVLDPATARLTMQTESYVASAIQAERSADDTLTSHTGASTIVNDDRVGESNVTGTVVSADTLSFVVGVTLFIVLVLIVFNYVLEFARTRRLLRRR